MSCEKIFHIAEIIAKYVQGSLTSLEEKELEDWKSGSPEHQRLLEDFVRYQFLERKQIAERLCGKEKAYQQFCSRQKEFLHRKKIRIRWYGGIAAAVVCLFAFTGIFLYEQTENSVVETTDALLAAGGSKAVLTLADGRKMKLGREIPDTLIQDGEVVLNASGDCIAYDRHPNETAQLVYNQLDIPRKGEYMLVLSDGTKVWLNAETRLKYPVRFQGNERRVFLTGEAYFEVKPDQRMPFIVETEKSSVLVLGTSFNVRAYRDETFAYTTLIQGSVQLSAGNSSVVLKPDEQGVVDAATGQISKHVVDGALYAAWKEGRFVFENQTLEEIMRTLGRWYDVEVFYANEQVKEAMFNGNLKRYDDFNQIVKMLEMTGVAHFKIQGNTIVVSE